MAMDSSILAWKIPWTEKPGGLQSNKSDTTERLSTHTHTHTHTHPLQMYINFPCLKEYPPPKMDHLSLSLTYGSHHPPWSHQSLKSWLHSSLIFYLLLFCSYHQSPSYGIRKSIFFFSCFLPCKYCIWKVYLPPKTISATSKCVSLPSICWASHICFIQTLPLFF